MKKMIMLTFLGGLLIMSSVVSATIIPLNSDSIALADYSGLISVNQTKGSHIYSFNVSYAVYDVTVYNANGRFDPSYGQDLYIYAYQIFNSVNSNTDIKAFEIAITESVTVDNITYDEVAGMPFGITPHLENILPTSAIWKFDKNPINPGENSVVLLFTSDFAPGYDNNTTLHSRNENGISGISVVAPSLIPEPTTLLLLGLGTIIFRKN